VLTIGSDANMGVIHHFQAGSSDLREIAGVHAKVGRAAGQEGAHYRVKIGYLSCAARVGRPLAAFVPSAFSSSQPTTSWPPQTVANLYSASSHAGHLPWTS
jgi:hypothetical protein